MTELDNFSSRFNLINSCVEGGLDFVFFELSGTGFEFVLESSEHGSNSLVDVTNKVGGINSGVE